ncbi:MAG: heat-inducible transcriptional repressor HrcA [Candidatus Eiseniibacteriota bacterium]
MTRPQFDARRRRILTFVVESHVTRAEPVGSRYVRAAYHLSISPATIRNTMQDLEEMGFLRHPHTSAGRVPTEAGYRYYVDELMRPEPIPAATRRKVAGALRPLLEAGDVFSSEVSRILARTSRQLALVQVEEPTERVAERVDLVGLEGGVLVLAVQEVGGRLSTSSWKPETASDAASLRRASDALTRVLPIRGPREARAHAARTEAGSPKTPDASLASAVFEKIAQLLESGSAPAVRIDGADHIASQPEFQSPARLRPLVSLLAEREPLARALAAVAESDRPRVSIGRENGPGPMRECSIVGMRVDAHGLRGVLGVVGPVRMPYRRVVSLVSYIGQRLAAGS